MVLKTLKAKCPNIPSGPELLTRVKLLTCLKLVARRPLFEKRWPRQFSYLDTKVTTFL